MATTEEPIDEQASELVLKALEDLPFQGGWKFVEIPVCKLSRKALVRVCEYLCTERRRLEGEVNELHWLNGGQN